jgi:SAM-dependent methyltransferase
MSPSSDSAAEGAHPLHRLGARVRRLLRGAPGEHTDAWRRELPSEVAFWKEYVETGGLDWPDEYAERLDPASTLTEPLIAGRLGGLPGETASILDVGAGPMTTLGKTYPGKTLTITAVDPLAGDYDRLLAKAGVVPPVRTLACRGEELLERFPPESFDVAYARNSLDHSDDPARVIANMVRLVKPGGWVALRHYRTEAETERYHGLHQWNFDIRGQDLFLWSQWAEHNLTRMLRPEVDVECGYEGGSDHAEWVACVMNK